MEKCFYCLSITYYVTYIQNNLHDFFIDGFNVFKKRLMIKILMLSNVKWLYNSRRDTSLRSVQNGFINRHVQILLHQQERCYEINIVITQENFWYVFQDSSYSQAKCCNAFSSTYFFVFVTSRVQSPLLGSSKRGSFKSSSLSTTSDPSTWKQTDIALGIIQPQAYFTRAYGKIRLDNLSQELI